MEVRDDGEKGTDKSGETSNEISDERNKGGNSATQCLVAGTEALRIPTSPRFVVVVSDASIEFVLRSFNIETKRNETNPLSRSPCFSVCVPLRCCVSFHIHICCFFPPLFRSSIGVGLGI